MKFEVKFIYLHIFNSIKNTRACIHQKRDNNMCVPIISKNYNINKISTKKNVCPALLQIQKPVLLKHSSPSRN